MDGFIYFIQPEQGGPVKVGWCRHDARLRRTELNIGFPGVLVLLASAPGSKTDEELLHKRLDHEHYRGEWFWPGPELKAVMAELLGSVPEALREAPEELVFNRPLNRKPRGPELEGDECPECGSRMGRHPEKHWASCDA